MLKTKQVNIETEADPNFAKIEDYWDDAIVDKVFELLHEYQDLFSTKFSDLKGIIGDLGVMKITLRQMQSLLNRGCIILILVQGKYSHRVG